VLGVVARHKREAISATKKAALTAAKARDNFNMGGVSNALRVSWRGRGLQSVPVIERWDGGETG
jgi:hypothetical protein